MQHLRKDEKSWSYKKKKRFFFFRVNGQTDRYSRFSSKVGFYCYIDRRHFTALLLLQIISLMIRKCGKQSLCKIFVWEQMRAKLMFLLVENSMNRDYCFCNGNCFLHWNGSILVCVIGTFWRKTAIKLPTAKWFMRITIALRISFICLHWILILFRTFGINARSPNTQSYWAPAVKPCLPDEGAEMVPWLILQHNFFLSTDDSVLLFSSSILQH